MQALPQLLVQQAACSLMYAECPASLPVEQTLRVVQQQCIILLCMELADAT